MSATQQSSKIILYGTLVSPPCRAVLLTLKALNLDFDFQNIDLSAGEHLKPEFIAKNPLHTVPVLEDDGHIIVDSHAICAFLVRKYGKDDALYPKDFYRRALVDQRLYYETGVLSYTCVKQITRPLFMHNITDIPQEKCDQIREAYGVLEMFLSKGAYIAGDALTIADFCTVVTVSSMTMAFVPLDATKYPKLSAWLARMAELPYYEEANNKGAKVYRDFVRSKLPKNFEKLWQKAVANIKSAKQVEQ